MKYAVVTFGCRVNQADSLSFEEDLLARGATPADPAAADVVIVNTCSVTATADQGARQTIRRIARDNPAAQIVVTGCYATRRPDEVRDLPNVVRVVPNDDKETVATLILRQAQDERYPNPLALSLSRGELSTAHRFGDGDGSCGASIEPGVAGRTAFTLRVQTGCAEPCSYCIIPTTRGAPRSVPIADVQRDVARVAAAGFKEIAITGVHLGSYGRDLEPRVALIALLHALDRSAKAFALHSEQSSALHSQQAFALHSEQSFALHSEQAFALHSEQSSALHSEQAFALHSEQSSALHSEQSSALHSEQSSALHSEQSFALHSEQPFALQPDSRSAKALAERPLFRISSLEPMDCTREIVDLVASSDAFAPHFHLPLQHASNRMLRAMRRPYSIEEYADLVTDIRARIPHVSIGSDVIVGFPGETDADFGALCDYLERSPLSHVHVFPYSDRPGTAASTLRDKVPGAVIRERGRRVREIGQRLTARFRQSQLGAIHRALTLEDGSLVVTGNYLKLRIPPGRARNEWVTVRVTSERDGELLAG